MKKLKQGSWKQKPEIVPKTNMRVAVRSEKGWKDGEGKVESGPGWHMGKELELLVCSWGYAHQRELKG